MQLSFTIVGRPKGWQRGVPFKGRVITPKDMIAAKKHVTAVARAAMGSLEKTDLPLRMSIDAVYLMPKSWPDELQRRVRAGEIVYKTSVPDSDNLYKLIGDALNDVVYFDDAQIAVIALRKRYGLTEATHVKIESLGARPTPRSDPKPTKARPKKPKAKLDDDPLFPDMPVRLK